MASTREAFTWPQASFAPIGVDDGAHVTPMSAALRDGRLTSSVGSPEFAAAGVVNHVGPFTWAQGDFAPAGQAPGAHVTDMATALQKGQGDHLTSGAANLHPIRGASTTPGSVGCGAGCGEGTRGSLKRVPSKRQGNPTARARSAGSAATDEPTVYVDGVIVDQAGVPWNSILPFINPGAPTGPYGVPDPGTTGFHFKLKVPKFGQTSSTTLHIPPFHPNVHANCSEDDAFVMVSYEGKVVTRDNFSAFSGVPSDAAIADTTAQWTTELAYGLSKDGVLSTYDPATPTLRIYVSARTSEGGLGTEYSLLSDNGIDFDLELTPAGFVNAPLPDGAGQAESFVDDDGTVWMSYRSGGDGSSDSTTGAGIRSRASSDAGLEFDGAEAPIPNLSDLSLGRDPGASGDPPINADILTGLSIVRIQAGYRGYFSYCPALDHEADDLGVIYAATCSDFAAQDWTQQGDPDGCSPRLGRMAKSSARAPPVQAASRPSLLRACSLLR